MRYHQTLNQPTLEPIRTSPLITSCATEFAREAQNYSFAILHRTQVNFERTRQAFLYLLQENGELFVPAWADMDGTVEIEHKFSEKTQAAEGELISMIQTHFAINQDDSMQIEIRKELEKGPHTHSFGVLNSTWNARGPRVKTNGILLSAREGDWSHISNHASHESSADKHAEKMSVVIL